LEIYSKNNGGEYEMEKHTKMGLLTIFLSLMTLAPIAMPSAHASPPITWSTSKSFYSNGNLVYIVFKGNPNLYGELDIYRYYYASSGWQGGLVGYFAVSGTITAPLTAKLTATAYLCSNNFCYPVKTWESSINLLEAYLKQYLQSFFLAMCYYTNCFSLVSYVQSVIAPYIFSGYLGYLWTIPFIYVIYAAVAL
jgi:hypothetical protein